MAEAGRLQRRFLVVSLNDDGLPVELGADRVSELAAQGRESEAMARLPQLAFGQGAA